MLNFKHNLIYQDFLENLFQLQEHLNYESFDLETIKVCFEKLEKIFQNQIISLTSEGLEESVVSRWQLGHTEVHRAFRLLKTDFIFLCSAKNAKTIEQRISKMGDRLEKIILDCQTILELGNR